MIKYFKFFLVVFILLILEEAIAAQLLTPLQKSNFTRLTSYNDMMSYLNELVKLNDMVKMKIIGSSVEGRKIPALFFSSSKNFGKDNNKVIVLIYAQQHGNEPAGKEAALIEAANLLGKDKFLLNHLNLILVPQVNPDGAESGTRRNANKMDLNRNHVILSEPESIALHNLFLDWMPQVTLDMHETNVIKKDWVANGMLKDAEEMFGTVSNLNISKLIRKFAREKMLVSIGTKILAAGFRFHEYIVGSPFNGKRIRLSTTNINDGRESMGIYNTLSFIVECTKYNDLLTDIKRRTDGQISAIESFLSTINENYASILELVKNERNKIVEGKLPRRVALQMDYFKDPQKSTLKFPVFNIKKWKHEVVNLKKYEPIVSVKKTVRRPFAYVFSASQKRLIKLLQKHRIKMFRLKKSIKLAVESYFVLHSTPTIEEDKKAEYLDLEKKYSDKFFEKGDIIIKLNQKSGVLIPLLLEPESSIGIVSERSGRKYRFKNFIETGKEYPIFRILSRDDLSDSLLFNF